MSLSIFKIGIILSIVGVIWIGIVFSEGKKTMEEFILEPTNSHKIQLEFVGEDIGYFKVFMSEFAGEEIFLQVLDMKNNVVLEQITQTKMSVGYFDFTKNGKYALMITNISENLIYLEIEFGDTNSQEMIPAGIVVLVGTIMTIFASYIKLKNYKIAQPDENIS